MALDAIESRIANVVFDDIQERLQRGDLAVQRKHVNAPLELSEFIVHLKATGVRSYKGEFVTTTGEHVALDLSFERVTTQGSGNG